ncbi:MAG: hypothetical protein AB7S26_40510 [Sandaracinaceae bacterium]
MKLGRQLRWLLGLLIAVQVVTALAGIGLLERMSPAIGKILDENVVSVEAVESMLRVLAEPVPSPDQRARFDEALAAAEGNVTEPDEAPLLRTIRVSRARAMDGDASARARVSDALVELGQINRSAMARADTEARRLGSAGRWALAFLALVGLFATVIAARRTQWQFLAPLAELEEVVRTHHAGNPHRRCRPMPHSELGDVLSRVNGILDSALPGSADPDAAAMRRAVLFLLDSRDAPSVLLDEDGDVVAASPNAFEVLAARGDGVLDAARADEPHEAIGATYGSGASFRLVELVPRPTLEGHRAG